MNSPTDQNADRGPLSLTSQKMIELREAVFTEWEKRVRSSIQETQALMHPVLIDTLPPFYDNIAEALSTHYPRTHATQNNTLAGEHGGERARLTRYDHQALISEYQILRWTILDVLHENSVSLDHREALIINVSIDEGIKEAMNAFALVHSGLRERFVAALTHDLRTPLAAALLAVEAIQLPGDDLQKNRFARRASESLRHMDSMIKELLDSMALHSGQRLPLKIRHFDMRELVEEAVAQATTAAGPRFEILGNSVRGWWSWDSMRRALDNVIGNAIKYGVPDSPIHIKINEVHQRLLLSVHNEGPPIPMEEQENVFQMFVRAQAAKAGNRQGWGVGLPYVRSVAESHGGSIGIDSAAERGTTFLFDIPVDARPFTGTPTVGA